MTCQKKILKRQEQNSWIYYAIIRGLRGANLYLYLEKVTHEIGKKHNVTVATSDGLEQMIVIGSGAYRMSAREFEQEIKKTEREIGEMID